MTNPDELERVVERLEADMTACGKSWLVAVHKADLRLILAANRKRRAALERIEPMIPLLQMITVRQIIEAGPAAISAAGLDPWCVNEGCATGDEPAIAAWKFDDLRSALSTKEPGQ